MSEKQQRRNFKSKRDVGEEGAVLIVDPPESKRPNRTKEGQKVYL